MAVLSYKNPKYTVGGTEPKYIAFPMISGGLDAKINEINSKLETINSTIADLSTRLTDVENSLNGVTNSVSNLETAAE